MFTYKKEQFKVCVKVWMNEKDYYSDLKMVEQVKNLAKLPFVFKHIALSPDGHVGFGMPS
jgi:tRNA-splicing ligase RtcB